MANSRNNTADESWIKTLIFHFPEAGLIVSSYFLDVILDSLSTVTLWEAQQIWWFSVSTASIVVPEILISAYITLRLYQDNIKSSNGNRSAPGGNTAIAMADMRIYGFVDQKLTGAKGTLLMVMLCCATPLMVLPTIMLLYLSFKYYRALKYKSENNTKFAVQITYELMKLTAMEALFQAVSQMSLSSYIVLHTVHCFQLDALNTTNATDSSFCWDVNMDADTDYLVTFISAVISLTTLCFALSGYEFKKEIQWLRRFGYFSCFFMAIASRITVNGVIGSWYSPLWFAPPAAGCIIAFLGRLLTVAINKEPIKKFDLLYHVLFGGLLLAIPTIYGILVCLSYIGWAVWFYIETEVDIRYEPLALSVIMQFVSMAFVYILGKPFPLESVLESIFYRNKNNGTTGNTGTIELQEV